MPRPLSVAENRTRWAEAIAASKRGDRGLTLSDIVKEEAEAAAKRRAELVDDPFVPGEKVTKSLANIHPAQRLAHAVTTRFEEDREQ